MVQPESRSTYERVVSDLAGRGADAVVLRCTEIMLLLQDDQPVPLLDSMRTHAEAAVTVALQDSAALPA